jgi:hypothetical protein
MALKLNKTRVVFLNWDSMSGCSATHQEDPAVCLTCDGEPPYSEVCCANSHKRQQVKHKTEVERAPEEHKELRSLYTTIRSRIKSLGFHAGGPCFFLAADAPLDKTITEIRTQVDECNAKWQVCKADVDMQVYDIVPDSAHEESLRSLRNSVEQACNKLVEALKSGELDVIKRQLAKTKNLSQLLEGESKDKVDELAKFTARAAGWLKDAVDEGDEAIARAVEETRNGADRFAGIVADLFAAEASTAEAPTASDAPALIAAQA